MADTMSTLTKNSLVLRYSNGVDKNGKEKFKTQKFSKVKLGATDDQVRELGRVLGQLLVVDDCHAFQEKYFILG